MITVHKFKMAHILGFTPGKEIEVEIPKSSRVVKVDQQHNDIQAWAMVDTSSALVKKIFVIFGTGHEIPAGKDSKFTWSYQDTFYSGDYVWHVFEKVNTVLRMPTKQKSKPEAKQ
jgi:hypothetical protein